MIRREVERCTTILDQLSGRASADSVHETEITLSRLVDDVRYRLGESLSCRLDVTLPQTTTSVHAPAEPLRQTLVALVRNAFDASRSDQRVALHIQHDTCVRVEVIDSGRGMSPDESAHAGEPFFTTKPRGSGLGLGLFLARAFADQMGGSLRWTSSPDAGTAVVLELPAR
jgi:two-component system sensor histidine kinase RegB